MSAQFDPSEDQVWAVVEELFGRPETTQSRFIGIEGFLERLAFDVVLYAAVTARKRFPHSDNRRFKYFCGICWNQIDPERIVRRDAERGR